MIVTKAIVGPITVVMRVVIENAVKTSNLKPESQNLVKHVEDISIYVQKLKKKAPESYKKFQKIKNNIISNDKTIQNNNPLLNFILCKMYLYKITQNEKALTQIQTALMFEVLAYKMKPNILVMAENIIKFCNKKFKKIFGTGRKFKISKEKLNEKSYIYIDVC
nr:12155_t:CDS:2 [Entrophospora candida]